MFISLLTIHNYDIAENGLKTRSILNTIIKNRTICAQINLFFTFLHQTWPIFWSIWWTTYSHLICTLISKNQGLDKLRSISNLRKISGPAHLNFFFSLSPEFFSGLWYKSENNSVDKLKKNQVYWKKIQVCRTWNFSKVWNRP